MKYALINGKILDGTAALANGIPVVLGNDVGCS